ncbi:MAG: hypothetical protein PHC68_09235 [Syntrophorhabdaceae bacterium]|nr:hypothetical protein [Syntrophorhabdaceae bacterium]
MSKKKSLGQQLWDICTQEFEKDDAGSPPMSGWDQASERYKNVYEKIAKRLYTKWYRTFKTQTINEALGYKAK